MSEWLEVPHGLRLVAVVLGALGVVGVSSIFYQLTDVIGAVMTAAGAVLVAWILYVMISVPRQKKSAQSPAKAEPTE